MSIQPPSDIVLDVAQAADPLKSAAAAQRLMRLSASDSASGNFSGVLENLPPMTDNSVNLRNRLQGGSGPGTPVAATDARSKAYKGLEALIFQNLFETTLPHDSSLGNGMAGGVWRSMMAEQLAKQIVNVVDLGVIPKSGSANGVEAKPLFAQATLAQTMVKTDSKKAGSSS